MAAEQVQKLKDSDKPKFGDPGSYIFLGLAATMATGMLVGPKRFGFNRNLNAFQKWIHKYSSKFSQLVQVTPQKQPNETFVQNISKIVSTANEINKDRLDNDEFKIDSFNLNNYRHDGTTNNTDTVQRGKPKTDISTDDQQRTLLSALRKTEKTADVFNKNSTKK